jgi:hypothetical protein
LRSRIFLSADSTFTPLTGGCWPSVWVTWPAPQPASSSPAATAADAASAVAPRIIERVT